MQGSLRSRGLWVGLAAGAVCVAPWPSRKLSEAFGLEPRDEGHNFPELAVEETALYEEGTHPTKRPSRLVAYGTDFCGVYTDRQQHPLGWAAGLYRKHLLNSHGGCRAFVGTEKGEAVLHEVPLPKDFPYKSVRVSAHYSSAQSTDIEVDGTANIIHITKGPREGSSLLILDTSGSKLSPTLKLQQAATGRQYGRVLFRLAERFRPSRDKCVLRSITLPELQDAPVVGYVAQGPTKHIIVPGSQDDIDSSAPADSAAFLVAEIPTSMVERLQLQSSTPTSGDVGREYGSASPLPALRSTTGTHSISEDTGSTVEQLGKADAPKSGNLPNKWVANRSDLNSKFFFGIAHPTVAPPAGLFGLPQRELVQKMLTDTQTRRVLVGGAQQGDSLPGGKLYHSVPTAPGASGMALTAADCHPHTHQAVVSGARQRDYSDSPDWVAATTAGGSASLLGRRGNTALSVSSAEYLCTHARIAVDLLNESHRDQLKKMYTPAAFSAMSVCPIERKRVSGIIEGGALNASASAQAAVEKALS